jgi:hypothetical protein
VGGPDQRNEGVQVDIVMMRTPDGHGQLELTKFRRPALVALHPPVAPPNALGLRSVMFAVEASTTPSLACAHGGELIGEVVQYEDKYRLCTCAGRRGSLWRWQRSCFDE